MTVSWKHTGRRVENKHPGQPSRHTRSSKHSIIIIQKTDLLNYWKNLAWSALPVRDICLFLFLALFLSQYQRHANNLRCMYLFRSYTCRWIKFCVTPSSNSVPMFDWVWVLRSIYESMNPWNILINEYYLATSLPRFLTTLLPLPLPQLSTVPTVLTNLYQLASS